VTRVSALRSPFHAVRDDMYEHGIDAFTTISCLVSVLVCGSDFDLEAGQNRPWTSISVQGHQRAPYRTTRASMLPVSRFP